MRRRAQWNERASGRGAAISAPFWSRRRSVTWCRTGTLLRFLPAGGRLLRADRRRDPRHAGRRRGWLGPGRALRRTSAGALGALEADRRLRGGPRRRALLDLQHRRARAHALRGLAGRRPARALAGVDFLARAGAARHAGPVAAGRSPRPGGRPAARARRTADREGAGVRIYEDLRVVQARLAVFQAVVVVVVAVLVVQFWNLQVVRARHFRQLAENNRSRLVTLAAPRWPSARPRRARARRQPPRLQRRPHDRAHRRPRPRDRQAGEDARHRGGGAARRSARRQPYRRLVVKADATLADVAALEARRLELPEVSVEVVRLRSYPLASAAAHRARPRRRNHGAPARTAGVQEPGAGLPGRPGRGRVPLQPAVDGQGRFPPGDREQPGARDGRGRAPGARGRPDPDADARRTAAGGDGEGFRRACGLGRGARPAHGRDPGHDLDARLRSEPLHNRNRAGVLGQPGDGSQDPAAQPRDPGLVLPRQHVQDHRRHGRAGGRRHHPGDDLLLSRPTRHLRNGLPLHERARHAEPARRDRAVLQRVFLQCRYPARDPTPGEVGEEDGTRSADRGRPSARALGSDAQPGVEAAPVPCALVRGRDRLRGDRPGAGERDAAADGAGLVGDRKRRQAGEAAPGQGRTGDRAGRPRHQALDDRGCEGRDAGRRGGRHGRAGASAWDRRRRQDGLGAGRGQRSAQEDAERGGTAATRLVPVLRARRGADDRSRGAGRARQERRGSNTYELSTRIVSLLFSKLPVDDRLRKRAEEEHQSIYKLVEDY